MSLEVPAGIEAVLYGGADGDESLGQRFYDEGMLWLANRSLAPFGWALSVSVDSETGGKVLGLGLMRTDDEEGFVLTVEQEVEARRRFLEAQRGRPVAPSAPAATTTICDCGVPLWRVGRETGCGNPRCEHYRPVPRRVEP